MARKMIEVLVCVTCGANGRTKEEVECSASCRLHRFDSTAFAVRPATLTTSLYPFKKCIHGVDVTLSPHECADCSQAIAEARCPEM